MILSNCAELFGSGGSRLIIGNVFQGSKNIGIGVVRVRIGNVLGLLS